VTNAWEDALNRAARSVESPTYAELDETLEEGIVRSAEEQEWLERNPWAAYDVDEAFELLRRQLRREADYLERRANHRLRWGVPPTMSLLEDWGPLYSFNEGRSYEEQRRLYDLWKNGHVAGVPGESFHFRGTAIDFAELGIPSEPWHWEYNPTGRKMSRLRRWLLDIKLYWQERKYWREDGYRR
jgi:hypothetical protein